MNREVPYDEHSKCDVCGKEGAWDFMGDYICPECYGKLKAKEALKRIKEEP